MAVILQASWPPEPSLAGKTTVFRLKILYKRFSEMLPPAVFALTA